MPGPFANLVWTKVSNMAQQPTWRVFGPILTDEKGHFVKNEKGQPIYTVLKISPPPAAPPPPPPPQGNFPPIPVVFP